MKSQGAQYRMMFCQAGMAWGKGDVHKAIAIVEDGLTLATGRGDSEAARLLQVDLERYRLVAASGEIDLSC
jgi:hypothetical protein